MEQAIPKTAGVLVLALRGLWVSALPLPLPPIWERIIGYIKRNGSVTAPTLLPAKGFTFFVLPARGVVISSMLTMIYYHIY